jgi:prepilin-type N-terminal cleavage/methylation domain-containing protein
MRRGRPGHTLVEVLVAMFVFSSLLSLGFALLHTLLKLEDHGVAHAEAVSATWRLGRTFRSDVHRAESVDPVAAGSRAAAITLRGPGERVVRYQLDRGRIVRVVEERGVVESNDAFRVPMGTAGFEVDDEGGFERLTLVFDRRVTRRKRGDARELRIEALVGLDRRFAPGGTP